MAIAQMTKVMIVSYRDEAARLLEALQQEGIVEILNSDKAMVTIEWPELHVESKKPRDVEELVVRLENAISLLKTYFKGKAATNAFNPRVVVGLKSYTEVIDGKEAMELLSSTEALREEIDALDHRVEHYQALLESLGPWSEFTDPVESLGQLENASCSAGIVSQSKFAKMTETLAELGAVVEKISDKGRSVACIVACLNAASSEVQKTLRNYDFEAAHFEGMTGSVPDLIKDKQAKLAKAESELASKKEKLTELSDGMLKLQMLHDHYSNLLDRELTRIASPMTDSTVLFEGWAKESDFGRLEEIVAGFEACSVDRIEPGDEEIVPVEIVNSKTVRPFEVITRLYGMPSNTDVDPTVFLAPFFALFFGLCLTDAGYGIMMVALLWWALKKMKGDKGFLWLFMACSVVTIFAGALTGSWFGDSIQTMIGEGTGLDKIRTSIMLFDPMKEPMKFFLLSLGIGYIQILFGLFIAFFNNLKQKDYMAAAFEQLTWLIMLNSLLLFGLAKAGMLAGWVGKVCGFLAIIQAVLIFLFTERKSGLAGRIGGGFFALFSTVFYFGDILSYVRLMALGMVTAGLGMAVNILVGLLMDVPYVGWLLGAVLFVGGHIFNLAMSTLSSFVHSLRLQFVEFFPKFLVGGGKDFVPLNTKYKHVSIKRE